LGVSLLFQGSGFCLAAKTCLHPPSFTQKNLRHL
jgi:hypothetical protein